MTTTTANSKRLLSIEQAPPRHWVGNGFPVSSMFSYDSAPSLSPFLLLDYAAPADFLPALQPRGVGEHPHRGFETVTVVYQGEVEHRDSTGNKGRIGPGDVHLAHGTEESVPIADLVACAQALAVTAMRFCGT